MMVFKLSISGSSNKKEGKKTRMKYNIVTLSMYDNSKCRTKCPLSTKYTYNRLGYQSVLLLISV